MSAINLYVAVDWQGDREIERARGEGGRGWAMRAGSDEGCRGREERVRGRWQRERERETRRIVADEASGIREEEKVERTRKRRREEESTQATDTPVFINRNSI